MTRPRRTVPALGASLVLAAGACGDDGVGPARGLPGQPSATATVTLVAQATAFDRTTLTAAAGQIMTITYDNRDAGIQHNLHVQGTATGDAKTDIETGPTTQTLEVRFSQTGDFQYLCDVHPQQIRGTFKVTS